MGRKSSWVPLKWTLHWPRTRTVDSSAFKTSAATTTERFFLSLGGCECQIGVASSPPSSTVQPPANLVGMVTFLLAQGKALPRGEGGAVGEIGYSRLEYWLLQIGIPDNCLGAATLAGFQSQNHRMIVRALNIALFQPPATFH